MRLGADASDGQALAQAPFDTIVAVLHDLHKHLNQTADIRPAPPAPPRAMSASAPAPSSFHPSPQPAPRQAEPAAQYSAPVTNGSRASLDLDDELDVPDFLKS